MSGSVIVDRRDFLTTSGGLVLGFVIAPRLAVGQPQELDDRLSLRHLEGIRVEVGTMPSLARTQGLSAERLQADVEGQLLRAGVELLPRGGTVRTGDPRLQIGVSVSEMRSRLVASCVEVNFAQTCFLRRDTGAAFTRAQTWSANAQVDLGHLAQVAQRIRRETTRQVEQFIGAYRQVNR